MFIISWSQFWRGVVPAVALLSSSLAVAALPHVIRFGISNAPVGNPPRSISGWTEVAQQQQVLENEFRRDGIKIEWVFFKAQGPAVNEAMSNNQLDFTSLGDLPAIIGRSVGLDTRLIMVTTDRLNTYVLVRPNSGINSIKDLRGKRISFNKGTATQLAVNRILAANGLNEKDVRVVNLDPGAGVAAFQSGDLDAIFGTLNLLTLRDKGLAKVIYTTHSTPAATGQAYILANQRFASQYPQLTQRVVKALLKAAQWTSAPANRAAAIREWASIGVISAAQYEVEYGDAPLGERLSPLFDPFIVARTRQSVADAYRYKLIRQNFDVNAWIDRRYLDAALKDLQLEHYWSQFDTNGIVLGEK